MSNSGDELDAWSEMTLASPADTVAAITRIRRGAPAALLSQIAKRLNVTRTVLCEALAIPSSTVNRCVAKGQRLSSVYSERVFGILMLEKLVYRIVEESGTSDGFDASAWFGEWISLPNPALAGVSPASYLDTMTGQAHIKTLLLQAQVGVCA